MNCKKLLGVIAIVNLLLKWDSQKVHWFPCNQLWYQDAKKLRYTQSGYCAYINSALCIYKVGFELHVQTFFEIMQKRLISMFCHQTRFEGKIMHS